MNMLGTISGEAVTMVNLPSHELGVVEHVSLAVKPHSFLGSENVNYCSLIF